MAKDQQTVRRMFFNGVLVTPLLYAALIFIGFGALLLYPGLQRDQVVPTPLQGLFRGATQGIVLVGLLAVLMSTIDSFLHSMSVTIVIDFFALHQKPATTQLKNLYKTQLIGLLGGIFSLYVASVWQANLYLYYVAQVLFSLFLIPFLIGVMGIQTHARDFWVALVCALLAMGVGFGLHIQQWRTWWYSHYMNTIWLLGITTYLATYFLSHYLRNGRLLWLNPKSSANTLA